MMEVKALDCGDGRAADAKMYLLELAFYSQFVPKAKAIAEMQRRIVQIREQIHFSHEIDLTVIKSIGEMIAKMQEPVN